MSVATENRTSVRMLVEKWDRSSERVELTYTPGVGVRQLGGQGDDRVVASVGGAGRPGFVAGRRQSFPEAELRAPPARPEPCDQNVESLANGLARKQTKTVRSDMSKTAQDLHAPPMSRKTSIESSKSTRDLREPPKSRQAPVEPSKAARDLGTRKSLSIAPSESVREFGNQRGVSPRRRIPLGPRSSARELGVRKSASPERQPPINRSATSRDLGLRRPRMSMELTRTPLGRSQLRKSLDVKAQGADQQATLVPIPEHRTPKPERQSSTFQQAPNSRLRQPRAPTPASKAIRAYSFTEQPKPGAVVEGEEGGEQDVKSKEEVDQMSTNVRPSGVPGLVRAPTMLSRSGRDLNKVGPLVRSTSVAGLRPKDQIERVCSDVSELDKEQNTGATKADTCEIVKSSSPVESEDGDASHETSSDTSTEEVQSKARAPKTEREGVYAQKYEQARLINAKLAARVKGLDMYCKQASKEVQELREAGDTAAAERRQLARSLHEQELKVYNLKVEVNRAQSKYHSSAKVVDTITAQKNAAEQMLQREANQRNAAEQLLQRETNQRTAVEQQLKQEATQRMIAVQQLQREISLKTQFESVAVRLDQQVRELQLKQSNQVEEFNATTEDLMAEVEVLKLELHIAEERAQDSIDAAAAAAEKAALNVENELMLKDENRALNLSNEALRREVEALQAKAIVAEEHRCVTEENQALQAEVEALRKEAALFDARAQVFESQRGAREENETLRRELQLLQAAAGTAASLEDEQKRSNAVIEALRQEVEELQLEGDNLEAEIEHLTRKCESLEQAAAR